MEDDSESDCFWGFVSVFRRSDFYDPVGQSANKMETPAKQVKLGTVEIKRENNNESQSGKARKCRGYG